MVVQVYISGISGNKEVKKRQQRVLLILDSKNIKYEVIDIAEPGSEEKKDFMQNNSTSPGATISDPNPRHPLPPQLFNGDVYCGDYDQFDMANEIDEMEVFLKLAPDDKAPTLSSSADIKLDNGNGEVKNNEDVREPSVEKVNDGAGDGDEQQLDNNETDDQKIENGNQNDEQTKSDAEEESSEKADES